MITFKELVAQIIVKANPVENNIAIDEWNKLEQRIDFKFPTQYIEFINFYGTGRLCELIWILNPFSSSDRFNLLSFLENQKEVFNISKKEYNIEYPYNLFLKGIGILPFAFTDNGDTIYWNRKNDDKENHEIIVIDGRTTSSEILNMSFSFFINEIINKSLKSSIIMKDDIVNKNFDPLK